MNESLVGSAMISKLVVEAPTYSTFFFFNLTSTLLVAFFCLTKFIKGNYVLARLYFTFVSFICIFYQIPLVLFSGQVQSSLINFWHFSLILNGGAMLLVLWGTLSQRFDFRNGPSTFRENTNSVYFVTGIFCVIFLWSYLSGVSWDCTGLYALIFDPWLTLLAREFSVKLIGTSLSTYSLGAYVNAAAPLFVLLSVWRIRHSIMNRNITGILVGFLCGSSAIVAVLISGTKGLLMSLMVMLLVGSYFWCKTWPSRILTITCSCLFVFISLIAFELSKERNSVNGRHYDFASCSVKAGTCKESMRLLESMKERDYSLGLPMKHLMPIVERTECLCNGKGDENSCPSGSLVGGISGSNADTGARAETFAHAVLNRVFVIPFQVSAWNYMYAETESINGVLTLPFARRIFGESLNMPELVYQKYGTIFSMGDKTSTSTAPTTFFLAYPMYAGAIGFFIAIICIILLDLSVAVLAKFVGASLVPMLAGVVVIMAMNFMTSDFVTVLISHGGLAGLLMLLVFSVLPRKIKSD